MNLLEMCWPDVDRLDRQTPVVFPIAALEQHGHHMPLFTDSLLLGEIVRRIQASPIGEQMLWAPLQWFGNSHHHTDMPGTLSASPRLYLDLIRDLAENVLSHGFQRIVFVNGHGGNTTPSQQAIFELRQKYRDRRDLLLVTLTYWEGAKPQENLSSLVQSEMGHACEWETSMMLALRPDLVRLPLVNLRSTSMNLGALPGYRGWTMPDRSPPGHVGHPSVATAQKGELLLQTFANHVARYLERVVGWDGSSWEI